MISTFFIDRPVFANVIAIFTVLLGVVALRQLPVEQYPQVTPPTVRVSTVFPGANAQVVADTVAAPIEQQVNGVEGMLYMSSSSSSDGSYQLTVTFDIGSDLNLAQILVQNRVAVAEPQLPEEVRRQGVTVRKQSSNIVLAVSLTSPDKTYNSLFLSNFATLRLRDELSRVPGVGDVNVSGAGPYGMRIWLDPEKLKARELTTTDVLRVLREQNVQVAAGQIGQEPAPPGQRVQLTVTTLGRLNDPEQFEQVIVKTDPTGRLTFLRDVARIELGAQSYDQFSARSGLEAASVLIYQLPGSNALDVATGVRAAMERLSATFPPDLEYSIPFDTTRFVQSAINEVYTTLIEAGVLVLAVILIFLQDWRAVLVPATTVPVTIIGAFAVMPLLGFSINLLTLFGLILAIGIVVDDAIVIVENATHHIDRGLAPREATIKAMNEVTGPIISITLVLMAVFLPTAFLGGVTGQLYRQFALTIAATAVISAVNALTLKPVQCASYLRPTPERRNWFARMFNTAYGWLEAAYAWLLGALVRVSALVLLVFFAIFAGTLYWYQRLPTGFLPTEDQGYVIAAIQLPDASSLQRTADVVNRVNQKLNDIEGVESWFTLGGFSLLNGAAASNAATMFIVFDPWETRDRPELSQGALLGRFAREFSIIQEATVITFPPPSIQGLGVSGGFQMQVEDRGGAGLVQLQQQLQGVLEAARQSPAVGQVNSTFRSGVPQLFVDIDREKAKRLGVPLEDLFGTLQAYLGSAYVNDFNKFGRTYQVRVQADARYRASIDDIAQLEVRNTAGDMIPLGTLAQVERRVGPQILPRYNLYPTASIIGSPAPGASSGDALAAMAAAARRHLPESMGFDWTGIAFQELRTQGEGLAVMGFAVLLVYLVLAAQYESWILPLAVILVVPLGLLGAVAAVSFRGFVNDVYTQIGVVLIIALASKNAILIVEFARELRLAGRTVSEAALEAARLRFRPILMTSLAFILGVLPLVHATGAGAASRQSLGTAVFGGMLSSTILAVFFVPPFYVVFQWLIEKISGPPRGTPQPEKTPTPTGPEGKAGEHQAPEARAAAAAVPAPPVPG